VPPHNSKVSASPPCEPAPPDQPITLPVETLLDLTFRDATDLLVLLRVSPDGRYFVERFNASALAFFKRVFPRISHADWLAADMATQLLAKGGVDAGQVRVLLAPHAEAVRTRRPVSSDTEISTNAEQPVARNYVLTPVQDGAGRVSHLLYRGTDITALRRAEARSDRASREAKETAERFATLFEISPVPLSIVRMRDGVRMHVNAAWLAFHGLTREQSVGRPARERNVWADAVERDDMVAAFRREGRTPSRLVQMIGAGGELRTARISMESLVWQGEDCIVSVTLDVTDLERARAQAQAAHARMEAILEQSPVGISISSLADGRYRYVNPAWAQAFGIDRERALTLDSVQSGVWPNHEERLAFYGPLRERRRDIQVTRPFRHPDGRVVQTLVSAQLLDYNGEPCVLALTQDVTAREQAQEAARLSGERFVKLFEMSPVPLVIGRASDGAYLAVNSAFLSLHGYRREDLVGKTSVEIGVWPAPQDRARVAGMLADGGEVRALPQQFRTKSGALIDTLYYATRIDWQGEAAILAAPQDITEFARARREAETQGARFQAMFRSSPNPSCVTTMADGRYLAVNEAWSRTIGYSQEQMLGRRGVELRIWADAADREPFVGALRAQGMLRHMPARFRTRAGEIRRMHVSCEIIDWEGEQAILSSMHDVTDLEAARAQAQDLSERFEKLFRVSPSPTFVSTIAEGRYLDVNEATVRTVGYAREEMIGRSGLELGIWIDASDRDAFVAPLRQDGRVESAPIRIRTRSGEILQTHISAEITEWRGEKVLISSMHDVTELKHAADEIRRLNESLEQKVRDRTAELETALREIESFSYTVSHDLRAPLRHISAFAGLLLQRPAVRDDAESAGYANRLKAAAARLGGMVDALLEYSRIGSKQIAAAPVDLGAEIRQIVEELGSQLGARRVRWDIGALPRVSGDPVLLRLLLQNLIDNALKFTRQQDEARIEVGARREGADWILHVRDNGVGFDMAHGEKLFGVFQRLHGEKEFEGTGIGLAHAFRIVERHRGRIWFDAAPGRGASFFFSLPAAEV
jgi:PAS domain S-box-containing protein